MSGPTIEFRIHLRTGAKGAKRVRQGARPAPPRTEPGRVPRLSRLMAMAIRFDQLIRQGHVTDYVELARLGGITRARISQIMDLLNLAPEIQEEILFLPRVSHGRDPINERAMRPITMHSDFAEQRKLWQRLCTERPLYPSAPSTAVDEEA
jgi:hypothetical protein